MLFSRSSIMVVSVFVCVVALAVVNTNGEPISAPYIDLMNEDDFTAFASFDGDNSDALALARNSIAAEDATDALAFEVIYRHPVTSQEGMKELDTQRVFTVEASNGKAFNYCARHPLSRWSKSNLECTQYKSKRACIGTATQVYPNTLGIGPPGDAVCNATVTTDCTKFGFSNGPYGQFGAIQQEFRGAQISKSSYDDIMRMKTECTRNAQKGSDCTLAVAPHAKECSWQQGWTNTESVSLTMRTKVENNVLYPWVQFQYNDNSRATYVSTSPTTGYWQPHQVLVPDNTYYDTRPIDKTYADAALGGGKGQGVNMAEWHHVVVNIDDTTVSLYVDGAASPIRITDPDHFATNATKRLFDLLYIGGTPLGGRGFIGDVSKFRVFRKTLAAPLIDKLFTDGDLTDKQALQNMAVDFPSETDVNEELALPPQYPVSSNRQAEITSASLHLDGTDFLKLPTMHLTHAFTVEAIFKVDYEKRYDWFLCSFANADADVMNRFYIKRVNDGADETTPDKLEIGVQRDLDHFGKPFTQSPFKTVTTEPIIVPGVWHHIIVSVSDAYDVMVRVDGQLITHGSFYTTGAPIVKSNVTFDSNFIGAQNPNAGKMPGNIALFNVYCGSLGYHFARVMFLYPTNGVVGVDRRLRYSYKFNTIQAQAVVTGRGLQNTGTSLDLYNDPDHCTPSKDEYCSSEVVTAPVQNPGNTNQPTRQVEDPDLGHLKTVSRPFAEFAGVQKGSGMQLAPIALNGQGSTVELIFKHNNYTSDEDDAADHADDVLIDMRDLGANDQYTCSGSYIGTDASFGQCEDKTTQATCVPKAKNSDKVAFAMEGGRDGFEWNYQVGGCRWRSPNDDDTIFSLKFVKVQPATEISTKPMLALRMLYTNPANSTEAKKHWVQITGEPFAVDEDFGTWHHVFVTVTPNGRWAFWQDDRVISGQILSPKWYDGKNDVHRPGFVTAEPLPAMTFSKVHVGSYPNGYNTFQGDIAALRVYDQGLYSYQVINSYTKAKDVFGWPGLNLTPVANYTFQDPSWGAGAVKYSTKTDEQRTNAFGNGKHLFDFGGDRDTVILPELMLPKAFTVSIMFRIPYDIEGAGTFGLFSIAKPADDTEYNNLGYATGPFTDRIELVGINRTHARFTNSGDGKWVEWKGNWNTWINGANLLVVSRSPTGAMHARLNGRILMHGSVTPIAADTNDMVKFSQGFINAALWGGAPMKGQYSHVRIYDDCFGYDQVQKMFTDDIDGNRDKLRYEWTFAPDPSDTQTLTTVTETVSGANGQLNPAGHVTVAVNYVKPQRTWQEFIQFSGKTNDALALPSLELTSEKGLAIETVFQYTDPCPFENSAFCTHIRDTCTHSFPEYADAVLNGQTRYPGLESCITSMCCYCEYGYSKEAECDVQTIDLGFFDGGNPTVNSMCLLVNQKRFAPDWVTSDKGARPITYREGCAEYDQCPFVREGWQAGVGGKFGTRNTSTALCSALDSKCGTNETTKIVIGGDIFEDCVEGICCFCENGKSNSAICDSNTFTWNYGDDTQTTTINTMCTKAIASQSYDHRCSNDPFNVERFNYASIFALRHRGGEQDDTCVGINANDDALCGAFLDRVDNTVSKSRQEACCGINCTTTKGAVGSVGFDASIKINVVGSSDVEQKCQWQFNGYDDKNLILQRTLQQERWLQPGQPRVGFMEASYSDRSLFKVGEDGAPIGHSIYVSGEPVVAGDDFNKLHHVIINVEPDGSWTYWQNGEVRSGARGNNNRDFGPIVASPGSVQSSDGRSQMPLTLFDDNTLGLNTEGRIARLKIWNKALSYQEITNMYSANVSPLDTPLFDLNTYAPNAFAQPSTLADRAFLNRYSAVGLRFDNHKDSASDSHDHISLPKVKLPSAFTARVLVKPYIVARTENSVLFGLSSPHSSGEVGKFATVFTIERTNTNAVRVTFKRCETCAWKEARTRANMYEAETLMAIHVMVTNDDQITIMINHAIKNHGDPKGDAAIAGNEVAMTGISRINANIYEVAYPNPITIYTIQIYEGAQPYEMDFTAPGFNQVRYNWTFANELALHAGDLPQSGPGYPGGFECPGDQMTMQGNPTPERTPGRKPYDCVQACWTPQHLQPNNMVNWKDFPEELKQLPTSVNVDRVNVASKTYDVGENGTTFEIVFNASRVSTAAGTQHLFDLFDNGPDGLPNTTDDRRMRLYNSRIKVPGSQNWYQNFLTFEWYDGDRFPIADNLYMVPGKNFGFRLTSAPINVSEWVQDWHHVVITANAEGNWHMWQDGAIVSGYLSEQRAGPNATLSTKWLAHPGYVTAEPPCRFNTNGRKATCNVQFSNLTVGGSVFANANDGFRGDISAFRLLQHAVTPEEAYAMYWQGMEHGAYNSARFFEVDWVACGVGTPVGARCDDQNSLTTNDRCRSNKLCKGTFAMDKGTGDCNEQGQCNFTDTGALQAAPTPSPTTSPTTSPTPAPTTAPTAAPVTTNASTAGSSVGSFAVIGIVVGIVVLVIIVAVVAIILMKKNKKDSETAKTISFENPMYDDTEDLQETGGAQESGYMDVPTKHNPTFDADADDGVYDNPVMDAASTEGYMDVAPAEDDDDDDEEDI
eukprot:m.98406 g.98406  ORF g.98406 m.98406 type:complete len:2574 (+) comp27063_c2_seq1:64-7785(+)